MLRYDQEKPMALEQSTEKLKGAIDEGVDTAEQAGREFAARSSEVAQRARIVAQDAGEVGRDALESALACGKDVIRANPITAVAVVAALAYLCGRMKS